MSERTCARCGCTPADAQFKKDKRAPDGLGAYCKPCAKEYGREYYRKNKERIDAQRAARHQANRERNLAQMRKYRLANREKLREYDRVRNRKPERAERSRRWRLSNPELFRAYLRNWYKINKDRHHHHVTVRRMRMLNNEGKITRINRRQVWERDGGICGLCQRPVLFEEMHLDHIVPLARGGTHTYDNVQPAHESCNKKKWANVTS